MLAPIPFFSVWVACFVVNLRIVDGSLLEVVFPLNPIFGKFSVCFVFEESSSHASLASSVGVGLAVDFCFLVVFCHLCHRGSHRLSSLSEESC